MLHFYRVKLRYETLYYATSNPLHFIFFIVDKHGDYLESFTEVDSVPREGRLYYIDRQEFVDEV